MSLAGTVPASWYLSAGYPFEGSLAAAFGIRARNFPGVTGRQTKQSTPTSSLVLREAYVLLLPRKREGDGYAQPIRLEGAFDLRANLQSEYAVEELGAEALSGWQGHGRSAALGPCPAQGTALGSALHRPAHLKSAIWAPQRPMADRVGGKLVQRHAHRYSLFRRELNPRTPKRRAETPGLVVGFEFGANELLEGDDLTRALGDQRMGLGKPRRSDC